MRKVRRIRGDNPFPPHPSVSIVTPQTAATKLTNNLTFNSSLNTLRCAANLARSVGLTLDQVVFILLKRVQQLSIALRNTKIICIVRPSSRPIVTQFLTGGILAVPGTS